MYQAQPAYASAAANKAKNEMTLDDKQVRTIVDFFSTKPVLKAYLFGSYSRGEGKENSDIDLLFELDYSQPIGWDFIQMQLDLQNLLGKKVDLVSARGLSKYVQPFIKGYSDFLLQVGRLAKSPYKKIRILIIEKEKKLIYVR